MEKKKGTEKVLIEIEEPCVMPLVNLDEKEQIRKHVIKKITPEVIDLFTEELERLLKERYNLSPEDLARGQVSTIKC